MRTPPRFDSLPERLQDLILEEVARAPFPVTVEEILGFCRDDPLVRVRWRIWWRQKKELTILGKEPSLGHMSRLWNRHHTTLAHGIARSEFDHNDEPLDPEWGRLKQRAYTLSRTEHAERYRIFYPDLGRPLTRT